MPKYTCSVNNCRNRPLPKTEFYSAVCEKHAQELIASDCSQVIKERGISASTKVERLYSENRTVKIYKFIEKIMKKNYE